MKQASFWETSSILLSVFVTKCRHLDIFCGSYYKIKKQNVSGEKSKYFFLINIRSNFNFFLGKILNSPQKSNGLPLI